MTIQKIDPKDLESVTGGEVVADPGQSIGGTMDPGQSIGGTMDPGNNYGTIGG